MIPVELSAPAGRPAGIRRWWVLLILMIGMSIPALLMAPQAAAHATVASSDPADGSRLPAVPSAVTVTFDEPVGLDLGYLSVIDADGTTVSTGSATHPGGQGQVIGIGIKSGLGDGTYIVSWRVISADSHPVQGSVRFVVGSGPLATNSVPSRAVDDVSTTVAFDAARTAGYLSLVLLGGGWMLLSIWPAGRTSRAARRVLMSGWALAVVAAASETLLQGAYAAGTGLSTVLQLHLFTDTISTAYGKLHLLRLLLLAVVAALLDTMLSGRVIRPSIRRSWPGAVVFLALVFTFSDSGHASVAHPLWLALGSDMAHLTAMSVWIGGLLLLMVAILPRRDALELRRVLPMFSKVASICVLMIAVTGTYQAWRESGTIRALTTTTYGLLVLTKIVLFMGLLLLGNLSRLTIQRRYLRQPRVFAGPSEQAPSLAEPALGLAGPAPGAAQQAPHAAEPAPHAAGLSASAPHAAEPAPHAAQQASFVSQAVDTRRMRRSVLAELILAAVVLSVSGVLVSQPPGRTAVVAPAVPAASATTALDATRSVTVTVNPAEHGTVGVQLTLQPGAIPQVVTLTAELPALQLGPLPVALSPAGGSLTYQAVGMLLPAAGEWTFDITVQTSEFDAVTTSVQIRIN